MCDLPDWFTDDIKKKIKDDLLFIKTIALGLRQYHCFTEFSQELEFDLPRKLRHLIFHAALIHLSKIYFQV